MTLNRLTLSLILLAISSPAFSAGTALTEQSFSRPTVLPSTLTVRGYLEVQGQNPSGYSLITTSGAYIAGSLNVQGGISFSTLTTSNKTDFGARSNAQIALLDCPGFPTTQCQVQSTTIFDIFLATGAVKSWQGLRSGLAPLQ